jgi:hypothetical protein
VQRAGARRGARVRLGLFQRGSNTAASDVMNSRISSLEKARRASSSPFAPRV